VHCTIATATKQQQQQHPFVAGLAAALCVLSYHDGYWHISGA
jgi:hypothetical protein